jgi:hypothetical protein
MSLQKGPQYIFNTQDQLVCSPIKRYFLVPLGIVFLIITAGLLVFDWWLYLTNAALWKNYQTNQWYSLALSSLLPVFAAGLLLTGMHKKIIIDKKQQIVMTEAGWFKLTISHLETSKLPLAVFDRIVIIPTNWLGLDTEVPDRNLRFARPGTRYSVRLMGNTEQKLIRYSSIDDARQLARTLQAMTDFSIKELLAS